MPITICSLHMALGTGCIYSAACTWHRVAPRIQIPCMHMARCPMPCAPDIRVPCMLLLALPEGRLVWLGSRVKLCGQAWESPLTSPSPCCNSHIHPEQSPSHPAHEGGGPPPTHRVQGLHVPVSDLPRTATASARLQGDISSLFEILSPHATMPFVTTSL